MEALGSQVHVITEPDAKGGFLGVRLDHLRALCASDDRYVWLNQCTHPECEMDTSRPVPGRRGRPWGRSQVGHDRSTTTPAAGCAVSGAATRRRSAAAAVYCARCPASHSPLPRARSSPATPARELLPDRPRIAM